MLLKSTPLSTEQRNEQSLIILTQKIEELKDIVQSQKEEIGVLKNDIMKKLISIESRQMPNSNNNFYFDLETQKHQDTIKISHNDDSNEIVLEETKFGNRLGTKLSTVLSRNSSIQNTSKTTSKNRRKSVKRANRRKKILQMRKSKQFDSSSLMDSSSIAGNIDLKFTK
mmetsp:Transcript_34446/g.39840  ORF Transcript_34446/g.39840 Transcript_34446/m.39840 type:complete len:169 (+) Transcript_34446:1282-1788(+)